MNAWRQQIAQAVTDAKAVLSDQGYPETPSGGEAPFIIVMAYHILAYANEVNEAAVNGDMDIAMNIYHELLSAWEEMRAGHDIPALEGLPLASVSSHPAQELDRGIRARNAPRKAHAKVHGTPSEKQARWDEYQQTVDRIAKEKPHLNWMRIQNYAAAEHGVSPKTIQRNTRNPRSK